MSTHVLNRAKSDCWCFCFCFFSFLYFLGLATTFSGDHTHRDTHIHLYTQMSVMASHCRVTQYGLFTTQPHAYTLTLPLNVNCPPAPIPNTTTQPQPPHTHTHWCLTRCAVFCFSLYYCRFYQTVLASDETKQNVSFLT